jgi:hypothetical protein
MAKKASKPHKPRKQPRRETNQAAFDVIKHVIRLGDKIDRSKPKR